MPDSLVFLFEHQSAKLAQYLRRKFGKKLGCDEKSLIMFYQTLRRVLHFYKDVDENSTLVGIEFLMVQMPDSPVSVGIFLTLQNQKTVEIKNDSLRDAVMRMFAPKLSKDGKAFFHWKHIEEFEEKLFNGQKTTKGTDPNRPKAG